MQTTTSADGTALALDKLGDGQPIVLLAGATCTRQALTPTAQALAAHFTVLNPDRRGRGDSGDTTPPELEREIEDVHALLELAGDGAILYGHSSGAGLALEAVAAGARPSRLVMHEPPYAPDHPEQHELAADYDSQLRSTLADGRRADALRLFFSMTGMPRELLDKAEEWPSWPGQLDCAHTLVYDSLAMGNVARGGIVPDELLPRVEIPVLVLTGSESPEFFAEAANRIAAGVAEGSHRVLDGQGHAAEPQLVAEEIAASGNG